MDKTQKILYLIRRFIKKEMLTIGTLAIVSNDKLKKALKIRIEGSENLDDSITIEYNPDLIDFRKKGQMKKMFSMIADQLNKEYERIDEENFEEMADSSGYDPVFIDYLKKLN
jgi:hypothetical protein